MSLILVRKLLRDTRAGLIAVCVLLAAFEFLWCKVTQQSVHFMRELENQLPGQSLTERIQTVLFQRESGKMIQKLIGGENVNLGIGLDSLTVGYVHPLVLSLLCVWAIGRAAGAVAGELDKGTMELLLAQPIARWRVMASHFVLDLLTIPLLCVSMWAGTAIGIFVHDLAALTADQPGAIEPLKFAWAMPSVAALLFAVSGYTMLLSSASRSRTRVLGVAVLLTLIQFLINLLGQVWTGIEWLRPFTVFYYYQPQPILLDVAGAQRQLAGNVATLAAVGSAGYVAALAIFCRRDLPAPL